MKLAVEEFVTKTLASQLPESTLVSLLCGGRVSFCF